MRTKLKAAASRHRMLIVVSLVAFGLMTYGAWRVQPHLTIPDETGALERALRTGYERDPLIDDFKKGGNLHLYLLAASFVPVVVAWLVTGRFDEITAAAGDAAATAGWDAPPEALAAFYDVMLAGRVLSALFGVATVVVVYALCYEVADRRAAAYAAAALAASVGFVTTAHYATEDVPMAFFVMLCLYALVAASRRDDPRYLTAAALVFGLAVSTKALAGLLIVPITIAILDRHRPDVAGIVPFVRRTWHYPALAVGVYLLTTPSIFRYPGSWYAEVARYTSNAVGENIVYEWTDPGWLVQLAHLAQAQGLPLFLLSACALAAVVALLARGRHDRSLWLLVSFLVPYFAVIGIGRMAQFGRVLPLVPVLSVFVGVGASRIHATRHRLRPVGVALVLVVLAFSGLYTGLAVADFNQSRAAATEWTHGNIEPSAEVDVHAQQVYLPEFPDGVTVNRYVVHSSYPREQWQPGLDRLDCYRPDYVVLSSYHYFRFFKDPTVYPEVTDRYRRLLDEDGYEIVATFGPPIDTDHSAAAKFRASISTDAFPEDGNPTIVVLERTEEPGNC